MDMELASLREITPREVSVNETSRRIRSSNLGSGSNRRRRRKSSSPMP